MYFLFCFVFFFFFQAEDGIRDYKVTGVQTCALPISQQIVRALPPGIFPPLIIQYNAASVPVVLASLSSDVLPEQQLNDLGNNLDRKSTRLNSSHLVISYAVFCLKKKKKKQYCVRTKHE